MGSGRTGRYAWAIGAAGCLALVGWSGAARGQETSLWFQVGEETLFTAYWGLLPVGKASLRTDWIDDGGERRLSIRFTAESSPLISALYTVRDEIESVVDARTFLPVRYSQNLREGRRARKDVTTFHHAERKAVYRSLLDNTTKDIAIDADTRDVLCLVYYLRGRGMDVGSNMQFRVLVDDKLYDLFLRGLREEKVYLSSFGNIPCLAIEPKAKFGEVFVRKGTVLMWFSLDERHVFTKAVCRIPAATVKVVVQRVNGPGDDAWTRGQWR